jgi:hypothetical protein
MPVAPAKKGLLAALAQFDGSRAAPLQAWVDTSSINEEIVDVLLTLTETASERIQVGASWVLLNHAQTIGILTEKQRYRLICRLAKPAHWQVLLHCLQLLSKAPLSDTDARQLYPVTLDLAQHIKPFVRAWSFTVLYKTGEHEPGFRISILEALQNAYPNEKASVQARLRLLAKESSWLEI